MTLDTLMDEIRKLSTEERNRLSDFIIQISQQNPPKQTERILGLGKDDTSFWMSDDFDDELPLSFWLGEDISS